MRTLAALLIAASLTGCASKGDVLERQQSPAQSYRPAGADKAVQISATMERKYKGLTLSDSSNRHVTVYFDGAPVIEGILPRDYTGELGGSWNGEPVSTSCSSRKASATWQEVRCIVFIGNERTVTLLF